MDAPVKAFAPQHDTTTGKAVSLAELSRTHKAMVLVFLANRCGVTWLYADKIAALKARYGTPGNVAVVGVHSNSEETDAEITAEMKRRGVSLPVIDDKKTQTVADYFGATVTPYFVVIDSKGVLRYRGPFDKMGGSLPDAKRPQYLRPALDAVLGGKPVVQKTVRAIGCEITRRTTVE